MEQHGTAQDFEDCSSRFKQNRTASHQADSSGDGRISCDGNKGQFPQAKSSSKTRADSPEN
jgi:hypothetical protein